VRRFHLLVISFFLSCWLFLSGLQITPIAAFMLWIVSVNSHLNSIAVKEDFEFDWS